MCGIWNAIPVIVALKGWDVKKTYETIKQISKTAWQIKDSS